MNSSLCLQCDFDSRKKVKDRRLEEIWIVGVIFKYMHMFEDWFYFPLSHQIDIQGPTVNVCWCGLHIGHFVPMRIGYAIRSFGPINPHYWMTCLINTKSFALCELPSGFRIQGLNGIIGLQRLLIEFKLHLFQSRLKCMCYGSYSVSVCSTSCCPV